MRLVHVSREAYDFYIGREDSRIGEQESPFHNPFKSEGFGGKPWAVELFRAYIAKQFKSGKISRKRLDKMTGRNVGCWCHGDVCHGFVLKQFNSDNTQNITQWLRRNSFSNYVVVSSDGSVKYKKRLHTIKAGVFGHGAIVYGNSCGTLFPLFEAKSSMFGTDWHPHSEYKVIYR